MITISWLDTDWYLAGSGELQEIVNAKQIMHARFIARSPDSNRDNAVTAGRRPSHRHPLYVRESCRPSHESRRECAPWSSARDRKSTRLNSSHGSISYAVF